MKERPILFSTTMVKAILEGRKTITRRIVKNKTDITSHPDTIEKVYKGNPPDAKGWDEDEFAAKVKDWNSHISIGKCPYGQIGDHLWVREGMRFVNDQVVYEADKCPVIFPPDYVPPEKYKGGVFTWNAPIFMPRKLSRITLEVTSVRVERLQDITPHDASQEGLPDLESSVIGSFARLWNTINSKRGSWKDNPWVWVIEFKKV